VRRGFLHARSMHTRTRAATLLLRPLLLRSALPRVACRRLPAAVHRQRRFAVAGPPSAALRFAAQRASRSALNVACARFQAAVCIRKKARISIGAR
jgi:hypothetical protein